MSVFALLALDAFADAVRRRIAAAVAVGALLTLLLVDTCTSCATGTVMVNGELREVAELAGATGALTVVALCLWTVVLAGVLASDHLAQTLADGTALLVLARPVGRGRFALARLGGALGVAVGAGGVLLAVSAGLLAVRGGLGPLPALQAGLAGALGALTLGALAMTASLWLPRAVCALLALLAVLGVALADAAALAGAEPGGLLGLLAAAGPAFLAAPALAVGAWIPDLPLPADPWAALLRAALWSAGALALLLAVFGRAELGGERD